MVGLKRILELQKEFRIDEIKFTYGLEPYGECIYITIRQGDRHARNKIDSKRMDFTKRDWLRDIILELINNLLFGYLDKGE